MIDLDCGAFWTHCALKCVTSCDHDEVCEHPNGHHATRVLPPAKPGDPS